MMTIRRLIIKEIFHRKLNFILGLLSITVASGCLVGVMSSLRNYDVRTHEIIKLKESQTKERMQKMEDDYRKITKKLGFNLLILPKKQNLDNLYLTGQSSAYMPESYVDKIAQANSVLIKHLLPVLQQKVNWQEKNRTIILIGTRGEVPALQGESEKPMMDPVPQGNMIVGYELQSGLNLSKGDEVRLLGRKFKIKECYPERGNQDDITVWINLKEAQEMLNKRGKLTGIMALECFCATPVVKDVRLEVSRLLPDAQVIELGDKVLVRAEARQKAAITAKESIEAEEKNRARLRKEIEIFTSILVPVVIIGCGLWSFFLAFNNVRERSSEIGILRALGMRSNQIFTIFLSKAILTGFLGTISGYFVGFQGLFDLQLLFFVLILFPVLSIIASWIPAIMAARQDPVSVLRER